MSKVKTDIWMPLYIGDYLSATTRLNTEQHGAYLLLIMDYWKNGPPPDDDVILAQICRMSADAWSNTKSIVLAFFEHVDGHLIHTRIESEKAASISKKEASTAKAAAAAAKRWGKNAPSSAQSNASGNQQAMPNGCPSPSPSPSQLKARSTPPVQAQEYLPPKLINTETGEILDADGFALAGEAGTWK